MFVIERNWTENEIKEIDVFLGRAKALLATNDFIIKKTQKNIVFAKRYPMRHEVQADILKSLTRDDCIDVSPNTDERYADTLVFEFIKDVEILVYGEQEKVKLYIKQYIVDNKTHELITVISFHEEGMYEDSY